MNRSHIDPNTYFSRPILEFNVEKQDLSSHVGVLSMCIREFHPELIATNKIK